MKEKPRWLDRSRNVTRIYAGLAVVCAALILLDLLNLLLHLYDSHPHFSYAGWPGFNGLFGFAGFALLVLSGWPLRRLLMRKEDYYDD